MEDTLKGFEEAIEKTVEVAGRCDFEFKTDGYKFPEFEIPEGATHDGFIQELANSKIK